jgi:hypothetical protein
MSDVIEAVEDVFEGVGDIIEDTLEAVGDVVSGVGDAIGSVVESIGNTVQGILDDPLPTLLQIGGAMIGIPPYVTAAVITAARGGDLEDIAKSAAVAYASAEIMSSTGIGQEIGNVTKTAGTDFTNSMMENFNLPPDAAVAISKAATASLNSSIVGGLNAALTGRSVTDGITSGFTSGLIYSSTDSYFSSLNKDPNWGFSPTALNMMKGATSTALNTIVSGRGDPAQAVGNYIAYAAINMGGTELAKSAKESYTKFTTDTEAAEKAQDKYVAAKAEYDTKITNGEALRKSINDDSVQYQKVIDEQYEPFKEKYNDLVAKNEAAINVYNEQKGLFDHYKAQYDATGDASFVTAANAAAAKANAASAEATSFTNQANDFYNQNKPMLDSLAAGKVSLDKKLADFQAIKTDIEAPNAEGTNTAAKLKNASDEYQKKYDAWSKTKEAADRSAENYSKALADVATRDATIDALNTGAIKVNSKDADGNWTLSNGMTLTSQGKFMQDGQQVFTNAAGVPQAAMDFKAEDGSNVDFNNNAGRVLSETDVKKIAERDFGLELTDDEITKLAGATYSDTGNKDITKLADEKASNTFSTVTGKPPTDDQLNEIRKSGDVLNTAADMAINGLDLPADYIPPTASLDQKVSFGQAYAAARAAYGPDATFSWTDPKTGTTNLFTTEKKEEQLVRVDKAAEAAGKYDTNVVSYAKYKMLDNLSSPELNPADLTKGEMTKFVDAYAKANSIQRAAMLTGPDSATFKTIDTVLGQTARYNPTGEVVKAYTGPTSGSISAYDPTTTQRVFDAIKTGSNVARAGFDIATYDAAGVVTRGAQLLRDSLGLDTQTADKIQQFWSDSKDKTLKSLGSDDQRVVAGGIASGIESAVGFVALGPIGALAPLAAIAANNAYQDGAITWLDNNNKAYATKEEAVRAAGASNVRQLTPEENMKRTAVMTSLEIVGEAAGIPGMRLLMKGIPLTGTTGEIVNAVKNFSLGMANEQVSELLTTTAQMAADKWTSFGLQKNATLDDYTRALMDTALSTTAAVGTAGSISTATRNMTDLKSYSNPFSTNTGLDTVSPTVPSLKEAAKQLGISDAEFSAIQRNVGNSVRAGNDYIESAQSLISDSLQAKGMSTVKADAVAEGLAEKFTNITVSDYLKSNGVDPVRIEALTPLITSQLNPNVDTNVAAKNIASIFASTGMDTATASKAASRFYSYTVPSPTLTQSDLDLSNQLLLNAGIGLGSAYKPTTGSATVVTPSGASVTEEQLRAAFGTTGSATSAPVATPSADSYTATGTLTGGIEAAAPTGYSVADPRTTVSNAVASMALPSSMNRTDVTNAITSYLTANPGLNAANVASSVANYVRANPNATTVNVAEALTTPTVTTPTAPVTDTTTTTTPTAPTTNVNARIAELIAQGLSNQQATERALEETKEQIGTQLTGTKDELNARIAELIAQGLTNQMANETALGEIKAKQEAEAKAGRASKAQAGISANLARGAAMVTPAAAGLIDATSPGFADIGIKTTGEAKFEGPLEQYMKMLKQGSYAAKPEQQQSQETQQPQQVAPVQDELSPQAQPQPQQGSDYFNYGQQTDIDRLLPSSAGADLLGYKAGGLATPLFAGGGTTRHGRYAGGGLGVIEHSGKARLDFRTGNAVTGPGDGQSDDIPAMLADGEFVFPADVVAALGNGSTKAGSDKLYDMMHSIRAYHRSAKPKDLPPPAKKSPLDYLKKPARKVRR